MISTIGSANLSIATGLTFSPKVMEVRASRPAFFLLKSLTETYFSLKKIMNFYIWAKFPTFAPFLAIISNYLHA